MKKLSSISAIVLAGILGLSGCSAVIGADDSSDSSSTGNNGSLSSTGAPRDDDDADDVNDDADDADDVDDVAGELITATPAAGATLTGDSFTINLPAGWSELDAELVPGALVVGARDGDTDGFNDNINVVREPGGVVPIDTYEPLLKQSLSTIGAMDIEIEDRLKIAESTIAHVSASLTQDVVYDIEQYAIASGEATYVVTFSFSDTVDDDERDALAESVMASWKFTG